MSGLESHVGKEIDLSDIGHPRLLESISFMPTMLYLACAGYFEVAHACRRWSLSSMRRLLIWSRGDGLWRRIDAF